jgi:hypothetical protein
MLMKLHKKPFYSTQSISINGDVDALVGKECSILLLSTEGRPPNCV